MLSLNQISIRAKLQTLAGLSLAFMALLFIIAQITEHKVETAYQSINTAEQAIQSARETIDASVKLKDQVNLAERRVMELRLLEKTFLQFRHARLKEQFDRLADPLCVDLKKLGRQEIPAAFQDYRKAFAERTALQAEDDALTCAMVQPLQQAENWLTSIQVDLDTRRTLQQMEGASLGVDELELMNVARDCKIVFLRLQNLQQIFFATGDRKYVAQYRQIAATDAQDGIRALREIALALGNTEFQKTSRLIGASLDEFLKCIDRSLAITAREQQLDQQLDATGTAILRMATQELARADQEVTRQNSNAAIASQTAARARSAAATARRSATVAGMVIVLIALAVYVSASIAIVLSINRSLSNLVDTVTAVASRKDYSVRGVKQEGGELGRLVDGFNEMLSQIQQRDVALMAARDSLELRVEERTRELAKSLSLLNATLDSTTDGILAVDFSDKMLCHNNNFTAMWGIPPGMFESGDVEKIVPFAAAQVSDPTQFLETIRAYRARPEAEYFDVLHLKDGRTFERYVYPQRIENKCVGRVIICRDITERERAEQERETMEVQLRHAQKLEAIGRLAAGIAHEINTPTQYIGDNTRFVQDAFHDIKPAIEQCRRLLDAFKRNTVTEQMVQEADQAMQASDTDYLLAEVPKAVQQSLEGLQRVTKIVQAMKEFSHPGAENKIAVDLNRAIESTITVARNEWKYISDVVTHFDPTLPLVPCLPSEFNQVILNILVNATHAIADAAENGRTGKGMITVSTRQVDGSVEVRISDTGSGIPETVQSRIFDPFFTTKPVGKGTGQGLTIARSVVVDKHGGSIDFETEIGKGTTFIIRLPLSDSGSKKEMPK